MKAVISADVILEPVNTVIYYSPLIKAAVSPPSIAPPPLGFTHLSLHTLSDPLVNFLFDPSNPPPLSLCRAPVVPVSSYFPFYHLPLALSSPPVWFNKQGISADLQSLAPHEGSG